MSSIARFVFATIFLASLAAGGCLPPHATGSTNPPAQGFVVSLKCSKATYLLGESVQIDIVTSNHSGGEIDCLLAVGGLFETVYLNGLQLNYPQTLIPTEAFHDFLTNGLGDSVDFPFDGFLEHPPGTRIGRLGDLQELFVSLPPGVYRIDYVLPYPYVGETEGSVDPVASGTLEFTVVDPNDLANRD